MLDFICFIGKFFWGGGGGGWIEQNMDKVHLVWIEYRFHCIFSNQTHTSRHEICQNKLWVRKCPQIHTEFASSRQKCMDALKWYYIPMKTTYFSHFIVHIKICQLTCCFLEILTQQRTIYGINVSDGPNKSHLYTQDIPVVQKCYLFVFCLKKLKTL